MSNNTVHTVAANGFSVGKGELYDKYDNKTFSQRLIVC